MRRRFGKPPRHIVVGTPAKSDRRLRIANLHDWTIRGLAFAADELELAVAGLRDIKRRERPRFDLCLDRDPRALLAVIQTHPTQERLSFCDGDMEWSVVSQ